MKSWTRAAKTVGLLSVILLIALAANRVLNTNVRKYDSTATPEADGSRVLFFGTNQAYNGISSLSVWDAAGIEAYNFSAAGQYIGTTYYVMKDALEHQSPEVVVLDFECLTRPDDFLTISHKLYSLPMIAGWKNRYDMYQDVIGEETVYMIPLLRYHNRWKEITRMDARKDYDILGAGRRLEIQTETDELPGEFPETEAAIRERELTYLNRILELTREKGCRLVLLDMPSYSSDEMEPLTQAVKRWAREHQVDYCEANTLDAFQKMGLTPQDFADLLHLNIPGQEKLSGYVGLWLAQNCGLEDNRNTPLGQQWESRMTPYRKLANDGHLLMEQEMESYFELLKGGDYTIAISLTGNYREKDKDGRLYRVLERFGISREAYETGGAFVRGQNGEWLFTSDGSYSYLWMKQLGDDDLILRGSCSVDGNGVQIPRIELMLEDRDRSQVTNGVNVVIYSHSVNGTLETVGFHADQEFEIVRETKPGEG